MTNVVGLRGGVPASLKIPNEDLISKAQWLLDGAKAGEIQGAAIAVYFHDGCSGDVIAGTTAYSILGRLFALQERMLLKLKSD